MSEEEAKSEFHRRSQLSETIVDYNGPCEGYTMQIGVKVKTQFIDRNAFIRSQGYELPDKVKKNATQADVDKAYHKMHTNFQDTAAASSQLNAKEMQKFLAMGCWRTLWPR